MTIAIGDIHGCLDPLQRLILRLPPHELLVFLGDYIDRGPHSMGVVNYLLQLQKLRSCVFLRGNHEEVLLQAENNPHSAEIWLKNGGKATLHSYGTTQRQWEQSEHKLAFLGEHLSFYQHLPYYWEDPDYICVHAGIDLNAEHMVDQSKQTLLWIREKFFNNAKHWQGKKIAFGHTTTQSMCLPEGDIFSVGRLRGIDTGCVHGGSLTALQLETDHIYQEPNVAAAQHRRK